MPTILVVNDHSVRQRCRDEFEEDGYRVLLACDGMEACQLVRRLRPDVAILDVCMPGMDGLTVIEHMHSLVPEMPLILFTAWDDVCLFDARAAWATACVEKSEDLSELKQVVRAALAARRCGRSYRLGLPPAHRAPVATGRE
jgi:CheY-like chemotaxis protein